MLDVGEGGGQQGHNLDPPGAGLEEPGGVGAGGGRVATQSQIPIGTDSKRANLALFWSQKPSN